jgi:hypothetical protein
MQLALTPGVLLLNCRRDYVQVGLNPRTRILVDKVFVDQVLRSCTSPTSLAELVSKATAIGVPQAQTLQLLNVLLDRKLLTDVCPTDTKDLSRNRLSVEITNGNQLGLTIAQLLIGDMNLHVELRDKRIITPGDLTPWGPTTNDIGKTREAYVSSLVENQPSWRPELPSALHRMGLVVSESVADYPWLNPRAADHFMTRDIPHLAIGLSANEILVTNVIRPGSNACLQCIHETESDLDPNWSVTSGQLLDRTGWAASTLSNLLLAANLAISRIYDWAEHRKTKEQVVTWQSTEQTIHTHYELHRACGCCNLVS